MSNQDRDGQQKTRCRPLVTSAFSAPALFLLTYLLTFMVVRNYLQTAASNPDPANAHPLSLTTPQGNRCELSTGIYLLRSLSPLGEIFNNLISDYTSALYLCILSREK